MVEVVDSIIAELIVRGTDQYERNMKRIVAAHDAVARSGARLGDDKTMDAYASRHSKASAQVEAASNRRASAEKRASKATEDAASAETRARASAERASAQEAARAQADAEKKAAAAKRAADAVAAAASLEAAARERLAAVVARAEARTQARASGTRTGTSSIGKTTTPEPSGQRSIPLSYLNGTENVAAAGAQAEINHALANQFDLAERVKAATGSQKRDLKDQLDLTRRLNAYKAAGLSEDEAALRVGKEMAAIDASRAATARKKLLAGAGQALEGAGLRRTGGSGAAVAGITAVVGVTAAADIIKQAADYGNELATVSKELGLTTLQLQTYQTVARETGVSNEQLVSGFGQLASNLGKAQDGAEQQSKVFEALGINVKGVASAGDLMPTLIDRISSIKSEAQRATVETALFGEAGRRLDPLLSGGVKRVNDLAQALIETGHALSDREIQDLDQTSRKIAELKAELGVDISRVVGDNAEQIRNLASALAQITGAMINFLGSKPEQGLAILGALIGLRVAGPYGAIAGGVGGYLAGRSLEPSAGDLPGVSSGPDGKPRLVNGATPGGSSAKLTDPRRQAYKPQYYRDDEGNLLERPAALPGGPRGRSQAVQPGAVNLAALGRAFAPKPPKGPKGKSAETLASEAEARTKRYQDQLSGLQEDEIRAKESLTGDIDKRADAERDLADRALKKRFADIESDRKNNVLKGADPKLEKVRADELRSAAQRAHDGDVASIEMQRTADLTAAINEHLQTSLSQEIDSLQAQIDIATTNKERRRLGLELLEKQKQQERGQLETQRAQLKPGDPGIADIDTKLGALDATYATREQAKIRDTASPLDAYRRQLHEATDDTNEALQRVEVEGLGRLEDQLSSTIGKVLGLKGAFGELVTSVISDLARIEIEKGILGALGGSGGSGGGFFGSLLGAIGLGAKVAAPDISSVVSATSGIRLPGFATGGQFTIAGNGGLDQNILSINGQRAARVNRGETVSITPANLGVVNQSVRSSSPQVTVMAPLKLDLRNAVMTPELLQQVNHISQAHAQNYAAAYSAHTLRAANQQAYGAMMRTQELER